MAERIYDNTINYIRGYLPDYEYSINDFMIMEGDSIDNDDCDHYMAYWNLNIPRPSCEELKAIEHTKAENFKCISVIDFCEGTKCKKTCQNKGAFMFCECENTLKIFNGAWKRF